MITPLPLIDAAEAAPPFSAFRRYATLLSLMIRFRFFRRYDTMLRYRRRYIEFSPCRFCRCRRFRR